MGLAVITFYEAGISLSSAANIQQVANHRMTFMREHLDIFTEVKQENKTFVEVNTANRRQIISEE